MIMKSKKKNFLVVGLGEVLWDILPSGKQLGGAPANFAYHGRALGAQSVVVSSVGTDSSGQEIITRLEELGLGHRFIGRDGQHSTGTVTVRLDSSGKPAYTIHENAAWDYITFNSELAELAVKADAVSFGSLAQRSAVSQNTIQEFLKSTRPQCLRVFDLNLRQQYYTSQIIAESLSNANVLKLNNEELPVVASLLGINGTEQEIMQSLIDQFSLSVLAMTRGSNGSILCTNHECIEHIGYKVDNIVDTVGAGDAFTAALTIGLIAGRNFEDISNHANLLAGFVCSQHGATPPISDRYPYLK